MSLDELMEAGPEQADTAGGGGGAPDWAADIDPFPTEPTLAFEVNEPGMTTAFDPVTVSTANHLCAALVDLTGDPAMPSYTGINDEEIVFAGSLLKICAMYAAFALRAQVQAFVDAAAANGASVIPPDITSAIETGVEAEAARLVSQTLGDELWQQSGCDIPQTRPDSRLLCRWARSISRRPRRPLTDAQIDAVGEFGAPQGSFHEWMRSMLRWSNNTAASKCILALGYFYLNGSLAQAGFFDASAGGLWLSADYGGHDWVRTAAERQSNAAGQELTPRWATAQGRRRSNITATAAQIARLLTLIAQDNLVDATASGEMRALMDVTSGGIGSYAKAALDAVGRVPRRSPPRSASATTASAMTARSSSVPWTGRICATSPSASARRQTASAWTSPISSSCSTRPSSRRNA